MRVWLGARLAVAIALAGCQFPTPTAATKKPVQTASKAQPSPSPEPIVGTPLTGVVQMDARFLVTSGAGVVAAGGANVVAAGGGNVVAPGGGNVVAPGGGNYRLLASGAAAAAGEVAVGTILPVQGLSVQAYDMVSGKAIGKPATTDAKGMFKLGVPDGTTGNVLLLASVPGRSDTRFTYPAVSAVKADEPVTIDEDTAAAARFVRRCMVTRIAALTNPQNVGGSVDTFLTALRLPSAITVVAAPALEEVRQRAQKSGIDKLPLDQREAVVQRFTDALIAKITLQDVMIDPALNGGKGTREPALGAIVEVTRQLRLATLAKMKADPQYFANQDYMKNASHPVAIDKPSDVADFVLSEYMTDASVDAFAKMGQVFESVGMEADQAERMQRAGHGIVYAIGTVLITDKTARTAALAAFDSAPTR